ncbi:MAG: hypothetical protein IKE55_09900 [Kiritimatiellae bacterium]|nr:hypothetical protein [Kiritimatiellia bacterium]
MTVKMTGIMVLAAVGALACSAATVKVAPDREIGPVKPVNGVGQPPMISLRQYPMFKYLKDAGIPFSRLHDVGGMFGRNVFVDIPNLFRDFDADETDPGNYDFAFTDNLIRGLVENDVEPFFRLGVTIENYAASVKRYRIDPPKDFAKWARICEHVIRHYTEGWADGFKYKISYWEIWNEPENWETVEKNEMWHGTFEEYCRLYDVASRHLKAKFPHLKIGGFASCGVGATTSKNPSPRSRHQLACVHQFLKFVKERGCPLDYFSYHSYSAVEPLMEQTRYVRKTLDEAGFKGLETCLNEWLPAPGHDKLGTAQQAAEVAAALVGFQNGPVDSAAIYDARCGVGNYSPLFNPLTYKPHKAYWAFVAFNELRKAGTAVAAESDAAKVWVSAAKGERGLVAMVVNFGAEPQPLSLDLGGRKAASCRITDAARTWEECELPAALPPYSFVVVGAAAK